MTESDFLGLVDTTFLPEPYTESTDGPESVLRLFQLRSVGARYALAVTRWTSGVAGQEQLQTLRLRLTTHFKAGWLSQIGAIAFFLGQPFDWETATVELQPDWHGLHPIIFQGVIFVDLATVRAHVARSQWGPIKFGNIQGQFTRVHEFLELLEVNSNAQAGWA
ncbi:MAG: hypothetical protein AB7S38_39960 [Vulcanimicrobiota bacterium]